MKKILASTLALIMAASVLTACGDTGDASSKDNSKATTSAAESKAEESKADESKSEESTADESAADSEEVAEPIDISEMPATLKNLEAASLKFSTDMDATDFAGPLEKDYDGDESHMTLSIEEVEGVPMLRVQTLDLDAKGENYKVPKLRINMAKLFAGNEAELPNIFSVKIEFVTKAVGEFIDENGEAKLTPGNFMGKVSTEPCTDGEYGWHELMEFAEAEWTSEWATYEVSITPGVKTNDEDPTNPKTNAIFQNTTEDQYLNVMKWGIPNQADYYIADITFYDADNNVIECNYGK